MLQKVIVKINCRICFQEQSIEAGYQDLLDWKAGKLIQNALPYLNDGQRELLISQTCGPCYSKKYPPYCGDCLVPITECSHKGEVKC